MFFLSDCLFMMSCTINLLILQYNVSLSFFHLGFSAVSWQKWQLVMLFWRDWSRRVQKQIKLLNILSSKLLFLRRKQVRKFENLSFLGRYLKWIHIVTAKKKKKKCVYHRQCYITSQSWWWLLYSFNIAIMSEEIFWD